MSSQTVASLRDTVFRAAENHNTPASAPPQVSSALIKKVKVVSLPSEKAVDPVAIKAFHLYLIVAGTSTTTDRYAWQNYVATIVSACFPSMKTGILSNAAFEEVIISEAAVQALLTWFEMYQGATSIEETEEMRKAYADQLPGLMVDIHLPMGTPAAGFDMDDVLDVPSVYGHMSLVLFLAGKTITDTNRAAISQKRPGAIERKYFNGKPVASLTGPLALSSVAHTYINMAFVSMVHLRRVVFTQVANFNNVATDPTIEVVATTTRLMRYAGMQQAILIDQFLSGHEEAFDIPLLQPSIQAYVASMKDLMNAPAEQRPYYKIIHGDTTRAFNRNDISNLLVAALDEARSLNPTLMQYNIPANHQLVMDKYREYLELLAEKTE